MGQRASRSAVDRKIMSNELHNEQQKILNSFEKMK